MKDFIGIIRVWWYMMINILKFIFPLIVIVGLYMLIFYLLIFDYITFLPLRIIGWIVEGSLIVMQIAWAKYETDKKK